MLNKKIRKTARAIIVEYSHFINDSINSGVQAYINSGVNLSTEVYECLFHTVLQKFLKVNSEELRLKFDDAIVDECVGVLDVIVAEKRFTGIIAKYPDVVYDTCVTSFKKVEEGLKKDGFKL